VLSSPVGAYDIVAAVGSLSATNYSFVTTNGVLTVGKAVLVVTASDQSRLYGAANPALTYTYSGFVDGDTAGVLSGAPALSTDASTNSPVGAYAIVVGQGNLSSTNYAFGFTNGTLTVGQAALTVSADTQSRGYGAADPAFTGLLAGVLNNDNLTATFASAATVSSPVGQYDILPVFNDPDGRLANYSVTTNKGTLSVTQVGLTVSADNQSRAYGAANPMLTGTLTGVVNGDNVTAGFDTIAGAASPVGAYDIVPVFNDPDGKLSNYTISTNKGTLTVSAAGSTLALSSSANPTPTGSNVTLTVTVGPVPPSSAVPAGSVQFLVDGQVFGWPLPLSGGLARLSTANLTHGLHSVCVQYTSDGNFNSSTNTLNGALLVNSAPVAGPMTLSTARNQAASLSLDTVLAKCSDPEQDALSITSVNAISAQGGTVVLGAVCITYTPPSNYSGPDSFTFTVQDAYAASATGTISVTVRPPIPPLLSAITRQADGNVKLSASGEPNQAYLVQAGTDLVNWSVISTNTADTNGAVLFLDLDATNYSTRFYRLAVP
jgi:hypothetical protein